MSETTVLDRLVSWTLDHEGDIYGDEQERLRWYEGIATASTVQWIVIPWTIAVMSWICGREVAGYLLVLAVVFYVPMLIATAYTAKKRVNLVPRNWTTKLIIVNVASGLPLLVMAVGLTRALDEGLDPNGLVGGAIGGAFGLVAVIVAARAFARRGLITEASAVDE